MTEDTIVRVLSCFGLTGLADNRMFSKHDLDNLRVAERVVELVPELEKFYIPCKARTYLRGLDTKKCITVLKQVLRLHHRVLLSRERNVHGKKVIYYNVAERGDEAQQRHMTQRCGRYQITFL